MATAPRLEDELHTVHSAGTGDVVVDLTEVRFLDSSGIRTLLVARRRLGESDRALSVSGMSDPVRRVLEIAGVLDTLAPDAA